MLKKEDRVFFGHMGFYLETQNKVCEKMMKMI